MNPKPTEILTLMSNGEILRHVPLTAGDLMSYGEHLVQAARNIQIEANAPINDNQAPQPNNQEDHNPPSAPPTT